MNRHGIVSVFAGAALASFVPTANASLIITGVFDGPLGGGEPKVVELYATSAIADLSTWGLESATNSAGAAAIETPLSGSIGAGEFLYVYNADNDEPGITPIDKFSGYFGFVPANEIHDATPGGGASFNGDDGIVLWNGATIIDRFGNDADADDAGEDWDYQDGWAYRIDGTGPDNPFAETNWTYSGENTNDGQTTNAADPTPFPIGTYAVPEPASLALLTIGGLTMLRRRRA